MTDGPPIPAGLTASAWSAIGAFPNGPNWNVPERDADGIVVGINVRWPDGSKRTKEGGKRGLTMAWPFPTYAGTSTSDPILIVEGATDAAAGLQLGFTTVGRPGAQGGKPLLEGLLRDLHVVVIGENDESGAGQKGARDTAAALFSACASVRLVFPPIGIKDLRAWLIAGLIREQLLDLIQEATPIVSAPNAPPPKSWPDPIPLPLSLLPVTPLDPSMLPDALRPWLVDIAERMQCPLDFPAVAAIVALSSIVGRKLGIRPKRHDDWLVVPNLYGGIVGRPGVLKSPALKEPLRMLHRLEHEAKQDFDRRVKQAEADTLVGDARRKVNKDKIKEALDNPEEARRLAMESLENDETKVTRKRYIVNDTTVEKLGELLQDNQNGLLAFRDELIGLLKSLEKEGYEQARSFYLEAWNGYNRFTYDRIGRGTIDIEAATLSILGGIQPGPLAEYIRAAAKHGSGDDGLIQRFQLLVYPDISPNWVYVDRSFDRAAREAADRVYLGLNHLDVTLVGADPDPYDPSGIPFLRFDDEAQQVFIDWWGGLELRVRSGALHPALESHLSKYRSLVPSLALLFHLIDGHTGPVGLASLRRALEWAAYLESHARRIYAPALVPNEVSARALAVKLLDRDLKDGFSLREIYRKGWTSLSNEEDARAAVEYLLDLNWLIAETVPTTGRPSIVYFINPHIKPSLIGDMRQPPPTGTDRTDKSPPSSPSVSSVSSSTGQSSDFGGEQPPITTPSVSSVSPSTGGLAHSESPPPETPPSNSPDAGDGL